jgi:hypothetical protein
MGKFALLAVGITVLVAVGCAAPKPVPGAAVQNGVAVFAATGSSVVTKDGDALAMLEAQVAAELMAKAALLAKIKGEMVTQEVSVGDLMLESQAAQSEVNGFLARAEVEILKPVPSKLGVPPVVTAEATLTLACADLAKLAVYVE